MRGAIFVLVMAICMPLAILSASADDFTLGIFGNANMDDTIDELDIEYVQRIIDGTNEATELADANYDGIIDEDDIAQIELIIRGEEKELTYTNIFGEAETITKPVTRIVEVGGSYGAEVLRAIDASDKIVAVSKSLSDRSMFFPELSKLPQVAGSWNEPDYEAILSQNPDAVITYIPQASYWAEKKGEWEKNLPGVNIITLGFVNPPSGKKWTNIDEYNDVMQSTRKLGYIVDKEDEAEEFCEWWEGYFNLIKSRTDGLTEDEKPRVFVEWLTDYSFQHLTRAIRCVDVAGGRNIAYEAGIPAGEIDPEWVIEQNPDIIYKTHYYPLNSHGYEVDDPSDISATRNIILNRSELADIDAVTKGRVYVISSRLTNGPHTIVAIAYLAKWFHPDLFEDLDPEAIQQEYLTRFMGLDYDLGEHGIFVYSPIITGDDKLEGIPDRYYDSITTQP